MDPLMRWRSGERFVQAEIGMHMVLEESACWRNARLLIGFAKYLRQLFR